MTRNRLFLLAAAMLTASSAMQAQTSYEAAALLDTDLGGTARFVGMGGAMGALGADMSTMSTNPAGIGLYRSWDMALSFGGNWVTQRTHSNIGGNRSFDSYGTVDNAGIVMATKLSNDNLLRFVNFGFNYHNVKRFGGKMGMSSNLNGLSQTGQMAWQAYENSLAGNVFGSDFDYNSPDGFYQKNYYDDSRIGWLTLLGADGRLIDASALNEELALKGENYYPSDANRYNEVLSGGIDAFDFNLSFNFVDAVYLGVTLTAYDVDRRLESTYSETFFGGDYTLKNYYLTTGSGYDFKLGVILRPIEESSFRVGVSATTPTVYNLRDYNSAIVKSNIMFDEYDDAGAIIGTYVQSFEMDTQSDDAYGGDCYTDYTMISPAKLNVSLGGTIGTSWALGAEYEYSNYGTAKLYYKDGDENAMMNNHTADNFKGQHILRVGVEKMFAGSYYARAGYNYVGSGYKDTAWKMIPVNSVQTNTAYKNLRSTNNITCGFGYRGDVFYADAALLYSHQTADFFPFDDLQLEATSLSRNLLKGMVTLGIRF